MGRPESSNDRKKSAQIAIRFAPTDYEGVALQASAAGLSPAAYGRRCILGRRIVARVEIAVLAELRRVQSELRRLGGLLKKTHLETQGVYSKETLAAIRALESYARHLERGNTSAH